MPIKIGIWKMLKESDTAISTGKSSIFAETEQT